MIAYMVTAPQHRESKQDPPMVWRAEVHAADTEEARAMFCQGWPDVMVSRDLRPSELEVEPL